MIALPLLGCAAAAIGRSRYLEMKGGWKERAILWCAVVAKPGTAKSPAAEIARGPLLVLQREARVRWEAEKVRYAADLATWESMERSERTALVRPIPPVVEHFITTNSTKESLEKMASTSPGFALYRDELVAWVAGFDAYRSGRGGNRQDMLSLWSGSDLKTDRKSADPIFADQPTVSVIGTLQPDRLGDLAREAGTDWFFGSLPLGLCRCAPDALDDRDDPSRHNGGGNGALSSLTHQQRGGWGAGRGHAGCLGGVRGVA
jgi:hypothetical protein